MLKCQKQCQVWVDAKGWTAVGRAGVQVTGGRWVRHSARDTRCHLGGIRSREVKLLIAYGKLSGSPLQVFSPQKQQDVFQVIPTFISCIQPFHNIYIYIVNHHDLHHKNIQYSFMHQKILKKTLNRSLKKSVVYLHAGSEKSEKWKQGKNSTNIIVKRMEHYSPRMFSTVHSTFAERN